MTRLKFAIAGMLAIAAAAPAYAVEISLPNATFRGAIRGSQPAISFFGLGGREYSDMFGTVSASVSDLPIFTVQAAGSTTNGGASAIAEAHAKYYFVLLSPIPTEVHIIIEATALAAGIGNFAVDAQIDLNAVDGTFNRTLAHAHSCTNAIGCGIGSDKLFDGGKLEYTVAANKIYSIALDVLGRAKGPDTSWTAFADPVISLNPAYAAPANLTFQFSPNLSPEAVGKLYIAPAAVPEPASWATMILGFAMTGAAVRRRRPAPVRTA